MTDSRQRVEVPITKHLEGLVQKGVPPSNENWLVFNAEIFVLRWSVSIPFDHLLLMHTAAARSGAAGRRSGDRNECSPKMGLP